MTVATADWALGRVAHFAPTPTHSYNLNVTWVRQSRLREGRQHTQYCSAGRARVKTLMYRVTLVPLSAQSLAKASRCQRNERTWASLGPSTPWVNFLQGRRGMPYLFTLAFLDAVVNLITGQVLG